MVNRRPVFFLAIALAMTATTFYGFAKTYFANFSPDGTAGHELARIVHFHGWTFFAWYLLLPLQAGLIRFRKTRVHRAVGASSVVLMILMTVTGFIVVTVNIYEASLGGASPFWKYFGPAIFSTLLLMNVFYWLALKNRRNASTHKRYMIVASAAGIGAAAFRTIASVTGFHLWVPAAGIVASNLFILAGVIRDWRYEDAVHPAFKRGLIACLVVEAVFFAIPFSPLNEPFNALFAAIGEQLVFLYG